MRCRPNDAVGVEFTIPMYLRAVSLILLAVACTRPGWQQPPSVSDLPVPRPCTNPVSAIWTEDLPLVSDTARQHIVSGQAALHPAADQATSYVAAMVHARFAIDTLGRVVHGSGIIEASSDERYSQVVCQALPLLKFEPVVIDGRKVVAGLIHVPFPFEVN